MENRPPLAPKPDSLKEPSPSHPSPTSSSSSPAAAAAGAPVPRPRKKPGAPPPAKPMPYRKHVELKDKEVSTFKSSSPVAPPRVRQRPGVPAAKPSPPSYRLSIPGEPSDLFQPKPESKAPVQYAIPQVPKRPPQKPSSASTLAAIDSRPRLNTPQVVPDPDAVLGLDKRGGAVPIESHGTPSNYHPTTQGSSGGVNGIAGGDNSERMPHSDEPELYTEAYAHVESEENDAEYAVVSPSRKAVVPTPQSPSPLIAAVTGKPPSPPRPLPPLRCRPPIAKLHRSPSPASSPSPPTVPTPSPPIPSTIDSRVDDHEYNTTSHVKDRVKKRSRGTPPIPLPISPPTAPSTGSIDDHEYNTTSHVKEKVKKRSRGTPPIPPPTAPPTIRPRSTKSPSPPPAQLSAGNDAYSVLDRPDKKPRAAPAVQQPSSELEEYSVLGGEPDGKDKPLQVSEFEEYSVLNSEPQAVPRASQAEGYGCLDLNAISAASNVVATSENVDGDSSLYEEVTSEVPVHDNKAGNSVGPSPPPPPLQPQMDKHPRALARKASDKFKDEDIEATVLSSRDRSKLPAYQQPSMEEEGGGGGVKERSGARLPPRSRAPPPVPHPKRQKKLPPQQNTDKGDATAPTGTNASESASVVSSNSKAEVPLNVLERAGYETRNTFSPPPEDMEVERKEQKSPQTKPPVATKRVSPVPAKARGPKPPPLPKPKQISPPSPQRAVKVPGPSRGQRPTKEEESTPATSTEEGQSMDYEPVHTSGDPSSVEVVGGSHDSHVTGVHVSSPKIELDIDHITRVGSALVDYDLENMSEALYDNQMVVNTVSLSGDTSPEQQKRASRTSYENQVVVDAVEQGDSQNGAADSTMEGGGALVTTGGDSRQGNMEPTLHRDSQGGEMEVGEYGDDDQVMESANGDDDACTKLTPSDIFTVPQHAVPGHLGYCDIDVSHAAKSVSSEHQQVPPIALARSQQVDGGGEGGREGQGDDSGTFVVQPHTYPDAQGYCDIEVQENPSHSTEATQPGKGERGGDDDSGTFVIQPHALPDSQGYCDIEIKASLSSAATDRPDLVVASTVPMAASSEGGGGGGERSDSGTFVVQPHAHPDSQGYCDIDIKEPPPPPSPRSSTATQPDLDASTAPAATNAAAGEVVTDARGYCDIDIRPPPTSEKPQLQVEDTEIVTDARGYCDIDILPPPTSDANPTPSQTKDSDSTKGLSTTDDNNTVMDAQGYCDIDVKTPPPKSVSHEYEIVPESAKQKNAASKGGSKSVPSPAGKAPPIPTTRPTKPSGKPVQDKTQEESNKASGESSSNNKGVPPKRPPPRRRAPPPPPLKSKTVDDPSENSPQSSPLKNELVITTGLATLPRSPKRQPPRPPPPFASSSSPLLSKKMSPLVGKKLELKSPLPSSSPLSSPLPPGSPKSLDSTSEQPQSSGFKKKFKGLFNKQKQTASGANGTAGEATNAASNSSSGSSGGLVRKHSWGRKKKGKATTDKTSQDNGGAQLSPSAKTKSLPGYALHRSQHQGGGAGPPPHKLQLRSSYDADQEDDGDEFGIYSTIQEDKLKPSSGEGDGEGVLAGAVAAAAAVVEMASPDNLKDDGVSHENCNVHLLLSRKYFCCHGIVVM